MHADRVSHRGHRDTRCCLLDYLVQGLQQLSLRSPACGNPIDCPGKKAGPPVHDDLVQRQFAATGPSICGWFDTAEHPSAAGKRYLWSPRDNRASLACRVAGGIAPPGSHRSRYVEIHITVIMVDFRTVGWCLCRVGERVEQGLGDLVVVARGA